MLAMNSALRSVINASRVAIFENPNKVFQSLLSRNSSSSATEQFETAKLRLRELTQDPDQDTQLKIYGLFKQASTGPPERESPGPIDLVGKAKFDSWAANRDMSQDDAKLAYAKLVDGIHKQQISEVGQGENGQKYKNILIEMDGGLRKIILNRPKKKNAVSTEMYKEWVDALEEASQDKNTVITVITGAGDFYCSGNDLTTSMNVTEETRLYQNSLFKRFVAAFIDFPKPLVGVINGPAIGIAVTSLGLFDAVYATDRATFHTPFTTLGLSPEGCSSYVFPKIMGYGKASELLFFNKKITAAEAENCGLVTEVFPDARLQTEIWPRLRELAKLPVNSLVYSKFLIRSLEKEILHKTNNMECERVEERTQSEDNKNAIKTFLTRKK